MGWIQPSRAIALPMVVTASASVMLVSGVWLSDLRDRMWGQEINTRHGETALPSSGSIHIIQQYLHCTIPPLIQS